MTNSVIRRKGALVILVAVLLRLAVVAAVEKGIVQLEGNPDTSDLMSFGYNLATGVGYAHAVHEYLPFSQPVEFSSWRPPLFPAVLAALFQFTHSTLWVRLVQVVFSAAALYLLLRIGFLLFGELPALIAGLIFALYPPLVLYGIEITTENLFLFLMMAMIFVFYQGERPHTIRRVFGLGVLLGLAALCRPAGLMLAPAMALAIWLTATIRRAALRVVVVAIAMSLTILPWTYRNYRLFHRLVLITTQGGATFWAGAHLRLDPGASMDEVGYSQHLAFRDVPEPERERYYYRQGFAILDHSPRRVAKMMWGNFKAMYTLVPSALYHSFRTRIVYSLCYIPLLITGVAGWILLRQRWRELTLLWAVVLTNTVLYCIYLGSIRYRVATVDPILALGSGVCLAALVRRIGRGSPALESTP